MKDYKTIYELDEIKQLTIPVFKKYQCTDVSVFGSYAKHCANRFSDVDFLVKGYKNIQTFKNYMGLCEDLENVLHKSIDLVTAHEGNDGFVSKIEKQELYPVC